MVNYSSLKRYIKNSELRIVNDDLKVRLSKELALKYDNGSYNIFLEKMNGSIGEIKSIGIKYPGNAKPIFYIYIVPDDNFIELLNFPHKNAKQGGRPVPSYDIKGFDLALGISSNVCENSSDRVSISMTVNFIHELAHLVSGNFFYTNRFIEEGFAETLPLYTLDYESKFDMHRNLIKNMKPEDFYSAKELIEMSKNNDFWMGRLIPNTSCTFNLACISSYLFVRGCMEKIALKYNLNRKEATQKFLEIVKYSNNLETLLVFDIAHEIDIDEEQLLNGKEIQINIIERL